MEPPLHRAVFAKEMRHPMALLSMNSMFWKLRAKRVPVVEKRGTNSDLMGSTLANVNRFKIDKLQRRNYALLFCYFYHHGVIFFDVCFSMQNLGVENRANNPKCQMFFLIKVA